MIEISETLPSYRLCNGCKGGDDVREIKVSFSLGNHSVGSVIALCRSCRSELMEVLKGADRKRGQVMTEREAKAFLNNLKVCIEEHPIVADWLVEIADRKTENSSEKPNNCEHITEDGVTCAKYPACDDCLDNPLNKVKGVGKTDRFRKE